MQHPTEPDGRTAGAGPAPAQTEREPAAPVASAGAQDAELAEATAQTAGAESAARQVLARWSARFAGWRARLAEVPGGLLVYRVAVAVVGSLVILAGIAMLALPGPGWLTIFLGLGILGTEFKAAHRLTTRIRALAVQAWRWLLQRIRR